MNEKDLNALRAAVRALDPHNDAGWTPDNKPDAEALSKTLGFKVTAATLVANGLNVDRPPPTPVPSAGDPAAPDPKAPAPNFSDSAIPEIKRPGPVPPIETEPGSDRQPPYEPPTTNESTTLHRNKRALETLLANLEENAAILGTMTKMSGNAQAYRQATDPFKVELKRAIARLT